MVAEISLFNRIVDLLIDAPNPEAIIAIKATPEENDRVGYLLERNKEGLLNLEEQKELDGFTTAEHIIRLAKSKAYKKLRRS